MSYSVLVLRQCDLCYLQWQFARFASVVEQRRRLLLSLVAYVYTPCNRGALKYRLRNPPCKKVYCAVCSPLFVLFIVVLFWQPHVTNKQNVYVYLWSVAHQEQTQAREERRTLQRCCVRGIRVDGFQGQCGVFCSFVWLSTQQHVYTPAFHRDRVRSGKSIIFWPRRYTRNVT